MIIITTIIILKSRASSVGIATGFGLDGRGSTPGRCKVFLFSIVSRPAVGPTKPPSQWVPVALSPRIKRQGLKADHPPPSSGEVKNGEAISLLSHTS
jgi:hypothetical protein